MNLKSFNPLQRRILGALAGLALCSSAYSEGELKWTAAVGALVKPEKFEVDKSNADVGGIAVYVTYEMLRSCRSIAIFARSLSSEGVVLGEAATRHSDPQSGEKYRDMFILPYKPGHSIVLNNAVCIKV